MNDEQFEKNSRYGYGNEGNREASSYQPGEGEESRRPRFTNSTHFEGRRAYKPNGNYRPNSSNRNNYNSDNYGQNNYRRNYNSQEGRPSYGENNGYQPRGDFQQRRTFSNGFQRENRWNKQRDYSRKDYNGGNDYGNNYQQRYTDRTKQGEDYRNYSQQEFGNRPARPNSTYNNSGKFGYNNSEKFGYNRNNNRPYSPQRNKFTPKKRFDYKEQKYDPNEPIRLNKYLANAGLCSRRDADKYIAAGVVTVNGKVVTELGTKVLRSDIVQFHDAPVKMEKKVYVLLNKPKGYVTTSDDPQNRKTVMELVDKACPERIYPVGRLDRNTTGVLLFTNDGEIAAKLTHPQFMKKKIYQVTTDHNVTAADIRQIAEGIQLEDGEIKADSIEYASPTDKKIVGIEIHSGRNRIVRRIFEHLGYHVVKLDRVYFAGLTKKNVRRGEWRYLTEREVDMLRMGAFE